MKPVWRLVRRIAIAVGLFAVLAGAAFLLWLGTEWLHSLGAPDYLYRSCLLITELLFALDVICFLVFTLAETIKFIRDIISGADD